MPGLKRLIPPKWRDFVAWRVSRRELRRRMAASATAEIVRTSFKYRGLGVFKHIYALQKESEIVDLAALVARQQPRVIVEIGTAKGGTLFIWSRTNPQLELLVSIDLPGGNFGGGYDSRREKLYREFLHGRDRTQLVLMRCDSHAAETATLLDQHLAGRPIDFLWIDGDHEYEGVKKDFLTYSQRVRKGGMVAFHDIITRGDGHEVHRLWDELKGQYRHDEFIEDRNSARMGIGVLHF